MNDVPAQLNVGVEERPSIKCGMVGADDPFSSLWKVQVTPSAASSVSVIVTEPSSSSISKSASPSALQVMSVRVQPDGRSVSSTTYVSPRSQENVSSSPSESVNDAS